MHYSKQELINATKARCIGDFDSVNKICIDSRDAVSGSLFIAMQGENAHGNDYAKEAIKSGASVVMTDKELEECSVPQLIVKDSLKALPDLARYHRDQLKGKVVGITGSVGKTSTRHGLTHALKGQCKVYASEKSYNNHVGLPLSLVNAPKNADVVICEVGTNHPGEITFLSDILRPDVAIITKIAPAHIGNFGSVEKIAKEKACIYSNAHIAIYPAGEFEAYFQKACSKKQMLYKVEAPSSLEKQDDTIKLSGLICGKPVEYSVPSLSVAWAENSLTVLTAVHALEFDINKAIEALCSTCVLEGRGACFLAKIGEKKITVIDDSYNANPTSMVAALDTLKQHEGRKIAVIGSMLELGDLSDKYHLDILQKVKSMEDTYVLVCGSAFKKIITAVDGTRVIGSVSTFDQVMPILVGFISDGDTVLFKASNSISLHKVVNSLQRVVGV